MTNNIEFRFGKLNIRSSQECLWSSNFSHEYRCYYANSNSYLNDLCRLHGSDKGGGGADAPYPWPAHSYADYFERHFGLFRNYVRNVFECGLGSNDPKVLSNMTANGKPGASLRVWRDYFPNAQVYGIDIDPKAIFHEERIQTFCCDQTNAAQLSALWVTLSEIEFDIIIDDGLHTFEAGLSLFESAIHKLRQGGVYIIEDVGPGSLMKFFDYFHGGKYSVDFVNLYRPGLDLRDNSLVVIRK